MLKSVGKPYRARATSAPANLALDIGSAALAVLQTPPRDAVRPNPNAHAESAVLTGTSARGVAETTGCVGTQAGLRGDLVSEINTVAAWRGLPADSPCVPRQLVLNVQNEKEELEKRAKGKLRIAGKVAEMVPDEFRAAACIARHSCSPLHQPLQG